MIISRFALLAILFVPLTCLAAGAHVHGAAILQIAVDGKLLQLNLKSPLDSLLGFEYSPRTNQQKSLVREMKNHFQRADRLFHPSPAAGCVLKSVTLESPVLEEDGHHGQAHEAPDHADLDGEFIFVCTRSTELRELEISLFDVFPGLRQLRVEAATPRGQVADTLTPAKRRMVW